MKRKCGPIDFVVWPVVIAYSEDLRMICAHCELRGAFRHFRTDRVLDARVLDERIPERVAILRSRWEAEREAERCRKQVEYPVSEG